MSKKRLKDIALFSKGSQINGENLVENGTYDYLNGGINPSGKWNDYNVLGDSITISEGGNSCGYVNYMVNPFWCGAHCYYLYDLQCDTKYLFYLLKSQQDKIMKLRSGACMPNIKKSDIGNFSFEYCEDVEIQHQIAENLDKVTYLIDLCNVILEKMDLLVKARFVEMFGDPLQPYQSKPLEDIALLERGKFSPRPRNDPQYYNGKYPFVQTGDIASCNHRLTSYHQTLNEKGIRVSKCFTSGTILIALVGATIGSTAILGIDAYAPDSIIGITPKENVYNNVFLEVLLQFWQPELKRIAPEAARANINLSILGKIPIINASFKEQNCFAAFVEKIEKSKFTVKKVLEKAETLKKALMQKYFE